MSISTFPTELLQSFGLEKFKRTDVITSSTTWTHPDGASTSSPKEVFVVAVGGGGGGGGGGAHNTSSSGTARSSNGGSGGGSGALVVQKYFVKQPVAITIGAGGVGGASRSLVHNAYNLLVGNSGTNGGNTSLSQSLMEDALVAMGGRRGRSGNMPRVAVTDRTWRYPGGRGFVEGGDSDGRDLAGTNGVPFSVMNAFITEQGGLNSPFAGFGSGGGGGGRSSTGQPRGSAGLGQLTNWGNGGNGGTNSVINQAGAGVTAVAGSGENGTGFGAGGGGGGGVDTSFTNSLSGAGGNGTAGRVIIFY
jgi:hypothetical protein